MASKSIRNPDERFVDAVKAGIEKLAADLNVPLSMGMGLTKAYFLEKGKVQAKVTAAEFEAAYGEIKAMHRSQTDEKKVEASDNGRLPLSDEAQAAATVDGSRSSASRTSGIASPPRSRVARRSRKPT